MDYLFPRRATLSSWFLFTYLVCHIMWPHSAYKEVLPALSISKSMPVKSYLLMDAHSGKVIIGVENQAMRLAPASLTKMMTIYLVSSALRLGQLQLTDQVMISQKAGTMEGSRMFLAPGTWVSVKDLIQGVIVQSGNDASVALAEHLAGSEVAFVDLMNQKAKELGMTGTHFSNASGVPQSNHYTTPLDMAILARAIILDFPEYYAWYSQKSFVYSNIKQMNRNRLLWSDTSVDGIKTGETQEAGYCLAASAVREGMRLIAVVMGASSNTVRIQAAQALLEGGFRFFETHKLYTTDEVITKSKVWGGKHSHASLGLLHHLYITIPRGHAKAIKQQITIKVPLVAPLAEKETVGEIQVFLQDECLATAPLVIASSVPEGFWLKQKFDRLILLMMGYWHQTTLSKF
jgi:D-alanyl-D-alanine carboxypeptidase (penicillin-binding protein 5/6)